MSETGGRIAGGSFRPSDVEMEEFSIKRELPSNARIIYPLANDLVFSLSNGEEEIDISLKTESFHWYSIPVENNQYTLEVRGLFSGPLGLLKEGFLAPNSVIGCLFEEPSPFLFLIEYSEFIYPKENKDRKVTCLVHTRSSCSFSERELGLHFTSKSSKKISEKEQATNVIVYQRAADYELHDEQEVATCPDYFEFEAWGRNFVVPCHEILVDSIVEEEVPINRSYENTASLVRRQAEFTLEYLRDEDIHALTSKSNENILDLLNRRSLPDIKFGSFTIKKAAMSVDVVSKPRWVDGVAFHPKVNIIFTSQVLVLE